MIRRHVVIRGQRLGLFYNAGPRLRQERQLRADSDGNIGPSVEFEDLPNEIRAAGTVVEHRRDRKHVQLRRLERKTKRKSVVDIVANVSVENHRNRPRGSSWPPMS